MPGFDADLARILDRAYLGRDATRRRAANVAALAPRAGEHILDLGCGTGLMVAEMALAVGSGGRVTGLDASEDMLATARTRCAGMENVTLLSGRADAMPLPEACADGIVSVQVFEYFDDMAAALAECRRVLRPGGRLVVGDSHWGTLVWHSDAPGRMAEVIAAYDTHMAEPAVAARLLGLLPAAGFRHDRTEPLTLADTGPRPDGLAETMLHLVPRYCLRKGLIDAATAEAWAAEQRALADAGRFFWSLTHFVTVAVAV